MYYIALRSLLFLFVFTMADASASETATLLEKLTQLITLQQSQLMAMQQTPLATPPLVIPPSKAETPLHPNTIPIKLDGKNYSLWSQSVRMYIKGREKLKHITESAPATNDPTYKRWDIDDTVVKGWICNCNHVL